MRSASRSERLILSTASAAAIGALLCGCDPKQLDGLAGQPTSAPVVAPIALVQPIPSNPGTSQDLKKYLGGTRQGDIQQAVDRFGKQFLAAYRSDGSESDGCFNVTLATTPTDSLAPTTPRECYISHNSGTADAMYLIFNPATASQPASLEQLIINKPECIGVQATKTTGQGWITTGGIENGVSADLISGESVAAAKATDDYVVHCLGGITAAIAHRVA